MQHAMPQIPIGELTDTGLAERIASGDVVALQYLMRRHNQTLYRTARSILKDDAEAEDAVQEAYVLAYRAMDQFRGDAKLSTWLIRIAVNVSIRRARKLNRSAEVIDLVGDPDALRGTDEDLLEAGMDEHAPEQPEHVALRAETRRLIEDKINRLPDIFRTVFVMRAVEEMSVAETAICLDIPEATVRTRYFRAKSLLREALAREIDFCLGETFSFAGERCDRIVAGVLRRLDTPPGTS
ncbi:MAG: RNA polymerase subunit sigma [Thiobacillus sp. SCN 64-317]|nr:MAG: RNA polymerase subunit sigma [Thiobacillus sp. SCN 64-317]